MADEFHLYGADMAMRNRFDGYAAHIAPRTDESLVAEMTQLKAFGSILRLINWVHLVFVTIGLLGMAYLVTYYYLIRIFDFPKDVIYARINEAHLQWLNHPINDRDVAYLVLFTFVFIADHVVLRAGKCMRLAEDHSMALIGAFVACLPVLNTISLPFGLAALVLLLKPSVEKRFR
jgi:hypothetical protein